jgi:hypothetical protein
MMTNIPPMFESRKKSTAFFMPSRSLLAQHGMPYTSQARSDPGHDLNRVAINPLTFQPAAQSCPLSAGPRACPFGGACHACPTQVRTKLAIGQLGDEYEQEADRVAEQVMRMPDSPAREATQFVGRTEDIHIQRACPKCGDEDEEIKTLQAKSLPGSIPVTPDVDSQIQALRGGGQPLDAATRAFMEPRFGYNFGQVRVHADAKAAESARAVNALAYTVGRDVVFGTGEYAPQTKQGKRLLAHELTHVAQQGNSAPLGIKNTLPIVVEPHSPFPDLLPISRLRDGLVVQRKCTTENCPQGYDELDSSNTNYVSMLSRAEDQAREQGLVDADVRFEQKGESFKNEANCPEGMKYEADDNSGFVLYLCKCCSLTKDVDKLAFNIVWSAKEQGNSASQLAGCTNLPSQQEVEGWANSVWDSFKNEGGTSWGWCGPASNKFLGSLGRYQGCAISISGGGHVITIGQYQGGWYVFDPTIDQFTTNPYDFSTDTNTKQPKMLEALENKDPFIYTLHQKPGLAFFSSNSELKTALEKYNELGACSYNFWSVASVRYQPEDQQQ